MDDITWDDAVMSEEIFGPIMPILTYESFDNLMDLLKGRDKPLALYLFSSSMGFGGVGESGMGAYHGKAGFEAFSHTKSIVDKKPGWICPCATSPTRASYTNCCCTFSSAEPGYRQWLHCAQRRLQPDL